MLCFNGIACFNGILCFNEHLFQKNGRGSFGSRLVKTSFDIPQPGQSLEKQVAGSPHRQGDGRKASATRKGRGGQGLFVGGHGAWFLPGRAKADVLGSNSC